MRPLPDPDLSFRDAVDYIVDCPLARRALSDPDPKDLALLIRDIAQLIHRLTISCHLPEFTDHGLNHLCSLLERISSWTSDDPPGNPQLLIERLTPGECALLLMAVLLHDIGMLSQRADDFPPPVPLWATKALNDVPNWVRMTHIQRMERVTFRGLGPRTGTLSSDLVVKRAMNIAAAHGSWPWDQAFANLSPRDGALAAVLAVSDLLDEDSGRCDITTLLNHRAGSSLNRAHWIRHGLTQGRVTLQSDEIRVKLVSAPRADPIAMSPVFSALRNHFRLAILYSPALAPIKVQPFGFWFSARNGVPNEVNDGLADWNQVPSFSTSAALSFQLLNSFFPLSLLDASRTQPAELAQASPHLEPVDLTDFRRIRGEGEPRSADEHVTHSLAV